MLSEHPEVSRRLLLEEFESECKLKDIADSLTRPRQHRRLTSPALTPPPPSNHEPTRDSDTTTHKQVSCTRNYLKLTLKAHPYKSFKHFFIILFIQHFNTYATESTTYATDWERLNFTHGLGDILHSYSS